MTNNKMIKNILGLSNEEAHKRFLQYGLNEIKEQNQNQFLLLLNKFWSPVPWMLEVTIILQLFIGKFDEAIIIAALLVFNSLLSYFQEERANKALILLKQHLSIQARVLRHSQWQLIPIQELVPGDVVHLRMGDISPADIRILEGKILIDQSILTGESLPIESDIGTIAYSGAIINRGEATGEVIATGKNTYFGKTVELVQVAKSSSHIKNIIFTIVKYLVITDIFFVACVIVYALLTKLPFTEVLPYILILLVASIPVALPATFTLATAMGAMLLARRGVLVTHLTAIEEAATMDILCLDKTGTITQNQLKLAALKPFSSYTEDSLLFLAAIASDESTQDPIDKAILFAAQSRNLLTTMPERIKFIPFDPTYKRTEAVFNQKGKEIRVLKGAPDIIINLIPNTPNISEEIYKMAHMGHRILAVAVESEQRGILEFAGLIALYDPPRADSKSLIKSLKEFGLKICMVTGDGIVTAKAIANMVGMGKKVCSASIIQNEMKSDGLDCDVFAGMFPENKFQLVQILQKGNHIVGMTGDGVNDAPALKQAEVGIAVSNATDVAKAAASIVLTESGLNGLQFAIETSRRIYQRMLTYTLNKIIKSLEIIVFLSLGVMLTGNFIITPLLIVLLLFANDFMTMSIATDNVTYSHKPEHWHISNLMMIGAIIAALILLLSFSVFFYGKYVLHLTLPQLQTLIFVMLVFTGQGNIYLIRERKHFWNSLPGKWLILSSLLDISIVSTLAIRGILMTPLQPLLIVKLLAIVIVYLVAIDFLKIRIFSHFNVH